MVDELTLDALPWAKGLTPQQLAGANAALVDSRHPAGSLVYRRGQKISCWTGISEGLLQLSLDTQRGKTIATLPMLATGSWFGEDLLLHDAVFPYDVKALRDTQLICLSSIVFKRLLNESIEFNQFVLKQLSRRLHCTVDQIEVGGLLDAEARIARCLATLFNSSGNELRISQEQLGVLTGTSRQLVNRAVQRLKQERLLATHYNRITLLDPKRLRTYGL